jgi:DNA-binding transcriptional regulator YiaG
MEWDSRKIKVLRKFLGLTQNKFADLLNTSHVLISYWERGLRRPSKISQAALTYLAEVRGVKKEDLVEEGMN